MNTNQMRILGVALLFGLIVFSGHWLSSAGKPYGTLLLTVHKLVSVGVVVLLVIALVRAHRAEGLGGLEILGGALTGLFFLSLIATGGLLSTDLQVPVIVSRLHQIAPYLTILTTAVTLYLL